ncbi:hypothetical protein, partial [Salsipaludibacter albus]|uniref:hypothetical protein n=1 Tax=Salsipaludibacter albus TaxID=2849650 RepID=UPI001EE428C2
VWRHAFAAHDLAVARGVARVGSAELADHLPDADGVLARLATDRPAWPFDAGADRPNAAGSP